MRPPRLNKPSSRINGWGCLTAILLGIAGLCDPNFAAAADVRGGGAHPFDMKRADRTAPPAVNRGITAPSIAEAFAVPLIIHPEARRLLESHYPPGGLNEARLRMAQVPEGAVLLPNPISRAPGFRIDNVFVLPGVPQIMQAIFSELKHRLKGGAALLSRSVSCALAEGTLAKDLGELQARYADLEIGSYPYFRRRDFGVTLVVRGTDRERLDAAVEELKGLIRTLGGDPQEGLAEE